MVDYEIPVEEVGGASGNVVNINGEEIPKNIGGSDVVGGSSNIAGYQKHKEVLKVTEQANPLVDSLKTSGELPDNFITKSDAIKQGWKPEKAIDNFVLGGQIGGDVFRNSDNLLPSTAGRVWSEADVGLVGSMSIAKQPGTRLLYSSDGLMYITTDHYNTFHFIGKFK